MSESEAGLKCAVLSPCSGGQCDGWVNGTDTLTHLGILYACDYITHPEESCSSVVHH